MIFNLNGCVPLPTVLNHCLISMGHDSTVKNVITGFKGAGIVPLERYIVLKRLPSAKNKSSEVSTGCDNVSIASTSSSHSVLIKSFEAYLEATRKSETTPLRKPRKKKIDVAPGITQINVDGLETRKNDKPVCIPTKLKSTYDEESSDEFSDSYSIHDFSDEFHLSSSEKEEFLEDTSNVQKTVKPENIVVGAFVVVKVTYDKRSKKESMKKFIGEILSIKKDEIEVKYLRRTEKAFNVYVFPQVDDIMTVSFSQIVDELKPVKVSRGRHTFPY